MADEEIDPEAFRLAVREQAKRELEEAKFAASPDYVNRLSETYQRFVRAAAFKPGQLVRWKEGLQNKTYPLEDAVGIVIECLDDPVRLTDRDSGSQYFRERLDMAVACLVGEERQFAVYWFDSRRFEVVDGE